MSVPPFACIHKAGGRETTYCDRSPSDEFQFTDADYAVAFYDRRKNPRLKVGVEACQPCCDAVAKQRAASETARAK